MTIKKPSGSILAPDDLRIRSYVVVHSVVAFAKSCPEEPDRRPVSRTHREPPPLGLGIPLQIRAISLPFLTCAVLQPGGGHAGPVILDVRGIRLMKVSQQYVRAISEFESQVPDERPDPAATQHQALARAPSPEAKS